MDNVAGQHVLAESTGASRDRTAWADWVLLRLQAGPLPRWLTLVLLTTVSVFGIHLVEWLAGPLKVGQFELYRASVPFYPFGILGAIALQYRITRNALAQFREAIPAIDDDEYARIEHRLTNLPVLASLIAGIAVALLGIVTLTTDPAGELRRQEYPAAFAFDLALSFVTYSFAGPWMVGVYRLLRAVNDLHQRATVIDLFHPGPLHAFPR